MSRGINTTIAVFTFWATLGACSQEPSLDTPDTPDAPQKSKVVALPAVTLPAVALPADAELLRNPTTLTVTDFRAENLSVVLERQADFRALQAAAEHGQIALAFVKAYAPVFGISDVTTELSVSSVETNSLGKTYVYLNQQFRGLSLWPSELSVQLDAGNHIERVQGAYSKTPNAVSTQPTQTQQAATAAAAASVPGMRSGCVGCTTQLKLFVSPLGDVKLAYQVQAHVSPINAWIVFVDAHSLTILHQAQSS